MKEIQFGRYAQVSGVTGEFHEPTAEEVAKIREGGSQDTKPSISPAVAMADAHLREIVQRQGGKIRWSNGGNISK